MSWALAGSLIRAVLPLLLAVLPPILSICPPILSVFDAGLVANAGGEKRAGRSGCQDEQERSCDPLSGDRG
jgi:hypothetical protein